ncbi:MFS transporter [Paenarthrobacter aurescens]|jgi:predicted MFS family arabinose efflux permease|uniref:Major facilitator superfamily (MFS) transporter n=1 Tax=Paenarthrobacter aurescens (strain TC1) TaxID=290340 RepID=A1RDD5_PAEAT|nr:MFS transporter [Paenarthrobacter aurescens]ABM10759.1 putative major facilitator superfamily (MFS) transporter [Paenarthrobacter aurescens TC1]
MPTKLAASGLTTKTERGIYTYIAVFSAVLNTVLLIAPVIAGKLVERYGVTPLELGGLFSLELAAFSLASLPAFLWLRRINLRTATYLFTALVIVGNIISGFMDSFPALMAARFITSLASGSIMVILLTLSGRAANPSRSFGIFVVAQLAMGALILAVFPAIYAGVGVAAMYWTLACLAALCLFAVRCIDGEALRSQPRETPGDGASTKPVGPKAPVYRFVLGLAAVLLFYIALSGVWTFIAQISAAAGIGLSASSLVLSLATVAGIASALVATILGDSPRRRVFLLGGYLGMGLSVALLFGAPGLVRFAIAAVIFKFAWTFILPYLLSTLAGLGNAHVMSVVNLMIGTGFAIGPLLSGALIESTGDFTAMLSVALGGLLISMAAITLIQRKAV